ncbi:MAG: TadE/TadG family type IV pilus assembly protein [Myxococcota bacterium]
MSERRSSSVLRDKQGAIMVLGAFMAVLLVACLYFVVGIGDAIFFRERMQDSADSGAFSAAVMHARGMNLVALTNMLQAALLAVLVALKLVETVLWSTAGILLGSTYFCPPCPGLASTVTSVNNATVRPAYKNARDPIYNAIEALHCAQVGLKWAMPVAAEARVLDTVMGHYGDQAGFGFAWPVHEGLPVEDGTFDQLCHRAGEYTADLAMAPITGIMGDHFVTDIMKKGVSGLVSAGGAWFCGNGGEAPSIELDVSDAFGGEPPEEITPHPAPRADALCREGDDACSQSNTDTDTLERCADDREEACNEANCALIAAKPDEQGQCPGARPDPSQSNECSSGDMSSHSREQACGDNRMRARGECASGGYETYRYQKRGHYVVYRRLPGDGGGRLQASEPAPLTPDVTCDATTGDFAREPELVESGSKPCDSDGYTPWNAAPEGAVCVQTDEPSPSSVPSNGQEFVQCIAGVSHIINCANPQTEHVQAPEDPLGEDPEGGSGGCMQRIPMQPEEGAELGEERFQLRSVVIGREPPQMGERGVAIATWGKSEDASSNVLGWLKNILGRFQVAQAEFYYNEAGAEEKRGEWLWHMSWRARLRRFRMPELGGGDEEGEGGLGGLTMGSPDQACTAGAQAQEAGEGGGSCGGIMDKLRGMSELIVH